MKYSLRNFLVVFLMSIVIFAVAAVFLVQYISSTILSSAISDEGGADMLITEEEGGHPVEDDSSLSYLVLGTDDDGEADYILFVSIDRDTEVFLVSTIPANLRVSVDGGYQRLGALAQTRGIDFVRDKVHALTSVRADYLIGIDGEGLAGVVDLFGGVDYFVPQAMYESDPSKNIEINLLKGQQRLNGAQARQLLQFTGYEGDAELSRANTCRSFVLAMCESILTTDNLMRASDMLQDVYDSITTDMTYSEASRNLETLFNFQKYEHRELNYPGHSEGEYYLGSLPDGIKEYSIYR